MKKVAIFPLDNRGNLYIDIVEDSIRKAGYKLIDVNENAVNDAECVAAIFNWYEDIYNGNPIRGYKRYRQKCRMVAALKSRGKKIIYVFHDKKPHNSRFAIWAYLTKKFLLKNADKIVILCNETRKVLKSVYKLDDEVEKKIVLIPHPNYIGYYDRCNYNLTREKLGIDPKTLVYLHIGAIAPYKNIEVILDTAKHMLDKDVLFLIAGPAKDNAYVNSIKNRIKELPNVRGLYGFVPNEEMAGLIETSDVMLVPHDLKSALNSGTVLLSFSYKRSVICSMIGTVKDFKDQGMFFGYTYKTKVEERKNFRKCVEQFYDKYYNHRDELDILNMRVYDYVKKYHSAELLTQSYANIIEQ